MTPIIRYVAIAALLLPPTLSRAGYCPLPPTNAWPSGTPQNRCLSNGAPCTLQTDCPMPNECRLLGTLDTSYTSSSCSLFTTLRNGLNLDEGDWDGGYGGVPVTGGWTASCGVNDFLTRLLNAGYLVRDVAQHSAPLGLHRKVIDPNGELAASEVLNGTIQFAGDWWNYIQGHNQAEWTPGCNNTNLLATNWNPAPNLDHYIELHTLGAFETTALDRAAVIVHETVHNDVGHIGENECTPPTKSCDLRFGLYNARTMEIDFLYDAATRYQFGYLQGQPVHAAVYTNTPSGRICRYNPSYSYYERNFALDTANSLIDGSFKLGPIYSRTLDPRWDDPEDADAGLGATWNCDQCDTSEWVFDPQQCQQTACNELLNAANDDINEHNAGQCFLYNLQVAIGLGSPEAISLAKANHPFQKCALPENTAARAYCNAQMASATHVSQLDSCGWLENVHTASVSKSICVQEFCHERFTADGGVGWGPTTDPYGCLNAICAPDGENCGHDLPAAECKQLFLAAHGNPDFYASSCIADRCQRKLAECLADQLAQSPASWEYPDPVPATCEMQKGICELMSRIATSILFSLSEINPVIEHGPGPVINPADPFASSPAWALPELIGVYRTQMSSGAGPEELSALSRRILAPPEMLRALFDLVPGRFVALLGTEGFEQEIGPDIHAVAPLPIAPADLGPLGQEALLELERWIGELPGEQLESALGSVRSQALQMDEDGDGVLDPSDNCPHWPNPDQRDADGNGRGSACECGDQDESGRVDVSDIVAINGAIFGSQPVSELCDANGDGRCDVADMVAVNRRIFGGPANCARHPAPAP